MPRPVMGNYDGAVVSGFFIVLTTRLPLTRSVLLYGRGKGYGLLWVSSERVLGVAKLVPHERKTGGCCGSKKHS